ncbi:MAG: CBS domain-containing protein [Acidilobaceae archaeon]
MLSKSVAEFSSRRSLSVPLDVKLERVRAIFRTFGVRVIGVVESSKLVGIIKRSDVIKVTATKTEALARDLASPPRAVLAPETTTLNALEKALSLGEWYLPVVGGQKFLGFFGLEDAIESCLGAEVCAQKLEEMRLEEIMIEEYPKVSPEDPLDYVWRLLTDEGYVSLPVVDEKRGSWE